MAITLRELRKPKTDLLFNCNSTCELNTWLSERFKKLQTHSFEAQRKSIRVYCLKNNLIVLALRVGFNLKVKKALLQGIQADILKLFLRFLFTAAVAVMLKLVCLCSQIQNELNESTVWKSYKDQMHDLFIDNNSVAGYLTGE